MNDVAIDDWNPAIRREAGQMLAHALKADPQRAHQVAQSLAPEGRGPGTRFGVYSLTLRHPANEVAYQTHFADLDEFLSLLEGGEPGAIEFALAMASEVAPQIIVPVAELLLPHNPWKFLGRALGRALGTMETQRSFELLLGNFGIPYLRDGLGTHRFTNGVAMAWTAYRAAPDLTNPTLDPRQRDEILPILSYLLRHDVDNVFPELIRLIQTPSHADTYAVHALSALPNGRTFLIEEFHKLPPGRPLSFAHKMAVKIIMENSPSAAVNELGGMELLFSADGRPRLEELLNCLRDDTWRLKKGWLSADPQYAEICVKLKNDADKSLATLARDLLRTLPPSAKPKPSKKTPPKSPEINPDILTQMKEIRATLEMRVTTLKNEGYRFANPKAALCQPTAKDLRAISRLEKIAEIPPVLKAFWQIVGSVDLRGHHPKWERSGYLGFSDATEPVLLSDPLVIGGASQIIEEALDDQTEAPIQLILGPDAPGKAGYSAGVMSITVPQNASDPKIDLTDETFTSYLTRALRSDGFLGLAMSPTKQTK